MMVVRPAHTQKAYYVLVSEWGARTIVSVHANSTQAAEKIARQNAGKKDGWEGIHKVYRAFPADSSREF